MNQDRVMTVKELCEYIKHSRKTVLKLLHEGKIKARKDGKQWRILESEVLKYLKNFDN